MPSSRAQRSDLLSGGDCHGASPLAMTTNVSACNLPKDPQKIQPEQLAQLLLTEPPFRELHRQVGPVAKALVSRQVIVRRQPVFFQPEAGPRELARVVPGQSGRILNQRLRAGSGSRLVRSDADVIDACNTDQMLHMVGKVIQRRFLARGDEARDDHHAEETSTVGDSFGQLVALVPVVLAHGLAPGMRDYDRRAGHLQRVPADLLAAMADVYEDMVLVQAPHYFPPKVR